MATNSSSSPESDATTPKIPVAKVTAISRFKSFTESLVPKRNRKAEPVFPPPSWNIEDFSPSSTNWTIPSPSPPLTPINDTETATTATPQDSANEVENIEPITFAKRLRAMIELLPIPGSFSSLHTPKDETPQAEVVNEPVVAQSAPEPPPIPPDMDKNLIKILSSEEVMNGDSKGEGKGRPGVWNLLAGLRRNDNSSKGEASAATVEEEASGVMMYAPLDPDTDSVVELAHTIRSTDSSVVSSPSASSPSLPAEPEEIRIWIPSTTELSVLTTWWGYRLYLPPPVMARLGATSVKAAARAAIITSALKWLIDKIPLLLIPVQFRPAIKMLKTLAPFAGYVGVFIAWSWDRIRMLDEGNGVVLTATWLLPVALIPMAWDAGDIYGPHLPPEIQHDLTGEEDVKDKGDKHDGGQNNNNKGKEKNARDAKGPGLKKSRF